MRNQWVPPRWMISIDNRAVESPGIDNDVDRLSIDRDRVKVSTKKRTNKPMKTVLKPSGNVWNFIVRHT